MWCRDKFWALVLALAFLAACAPKDRSVDECGQDDDCLDETPFCQEQYGICVECRDDENCSGELLCLADACRQGCHDDNDCDRGKICESSVCIDGCRSSRDCPTDWACLQDVGSWGACAECQQNTDCPGAFCDFAIWRCVDCLVDADCPADRQCVENACIEGADTRPPEILATVPPAEALDVPLDIKIRIQFNESVERISLDEDKFHLILDGSSLYGSVSYDQTRREATLVIAAPLQNGANYQAVLEPGIKDLSGNTRTELYQWSFRSQP